MMDNDSNPVESAAGADQNGPECIYFYTMPGDHGPEYGPANAFFYDNGGAFAKTHADTGQGTLRDKLLELMQNGRKLPDERSPQTCGWNFGDLRWRRKSYIAVVDFNGRIGSADDFQLWHGGGERHPSFKNAQVFVHPEDPTGTNIWYCVNEMLNEFGRPLKDKKTSEAKVQRLSKDKALTEEDTGTNMGPPVPPPARLHGAKE